MKLHKVLRHYFGLKVRGQHTCSTGRRGKTVGFLEVKVKVREFFFLVYLFLRKFYFCLIVFFCFLLYFLFFFF